jgi:hypothetical protein
LFSQNFGTLPSSLKNGGNKKKEIIFINVIENQTQQFSIKIENCVTLVWTCKFAQYTP